MKRVSTAFFALGLSLIVALLLISFSGHAQQSRHLRQTSSPPKTEAGETYPGEHRDRQVAARFAPIFHQGLGEAPRFDYITRFDFDGDWRGDNNWQNAADKQYKLTAYIYYSVIETQTHFFIHYAAFHPRDYKGGAGRGEILGEALRRGIEEAIKHVGKDPTGRADEIVLAHENDLEGSLVVVRKSGADLRAARLEYVETLAHNRFLKYRTTDATSRVGEKIETEGSSPLLFVEPRGHGIEAYRGDARQLKDCKSGVLIYAIGKGAEDPDARNQERVGYDLLPVYSTIWHKAQEAAANDTYGEAYDYQTITVLALLSKIPTDHSRALGQIGSSFRGKVGGENMARPPWGWFDGAEKERPRGEWFFDPAGTIKRHYNLGENFSTVYTHNPYINIFRPATSQPLTR
jgi:hypothetical protein